MSDAVAFALKAEYEGTVEQEIDGELQEVPKYQGGLLYVGDGDINIAEELEAGGGVIVVAAEDQRLRDLLDVYPPLKQVPAPDGVEPLSQYARQPDEALRLQGSLRDIKGAASMARGRLVAALHAHDEALREGEQSAAAAVAAHPEIADGLERLSKKQLLKIATDNGVGGVTERDSNPAIIAALRDAGVTAEGGDA